MAANIAVPVVGEIPLLVPVGCNKIVRSIKGLHQQFDLSLATSQGDSSCSYRAIFGIESFVGPAAYINIQP